MGPGERATADDIATARRLGTLIAERGWILLSGGRSVGVMDAVNRGAKAAGGITVGVMPAADPRAQLSDWVDIPIATGMGSARNAINVLSSQVVIACGSLEPGTVSEVALAIKATRPVILLTADDEGARFFERIGRGRVRRVETPEDAVAVAAELLADDHSETDAG